jgi:anti-sigma regulatory factor (Ser/Thr protein kinase)
MFVTCLFGVLRLSTGEFTFANAGHNLPYVRTADGVVELRATGMPLGLMPEMPYDVQTATLEADTAMLLTSDGIVEAHAPDGAMFGFDRLRGLVGTRRPRGGMMASILTELDRFCGPHHEQEDDVTMVAIRRVSSAASSAEAFTDGQDELERFSVPSEEGNERLVMERVGTIAASLGMSGERLERLRTAVSEASMNAIEHGNHFDRSLSVDVAVLRSAGHLIVRIEDHGSGPDIPDAELPDIDAKLAGLQSPRGWGLFLIGEMVDALRHRHDDDGKHVMELEMALEGAP